MDRSYHSLAIQLLTLIAALWGVGSAHSASEGDAGVRSVEALPMAAPRRLETAAALGNKVGDILPVVYVVVLPSADGESDSSSPECGADLKACTRGAIRFPVVLADGEESLLVPDENDDTDSAEMKLEESSEADDSADESDSELVSDVAPVPASDLDEADLKLEVTSKFIRNLESIAPQPAPPVAIDEVTVEAASESNSETLVDWETLVYEAFLREMTADQGALDRQTLELQFQLVAARISLWSQTDWCLWTGRNIGMACESYASVSGVAVEWPLRYVSIRKAPENVRRAWSKPNQMKSRLSANSPQPAGKAGYTKDALLAAASTCNQYGAYLEALATRLNQLADEMDESSSILHDAARPAVAGASESR